MLLKEIFSKKKILFKEIFHNKITNTVSYKKSYIRGDTSLGQSTTKVMDDNNILSTSFKNKVKKFKSFKENKKFHKTDAVCNVKNQSIKSLEGCSSQAQSALYKNKKNDSFRFYASLLKPFECKNHLEALCQSIENLNRGGIQNKSSLLILTPKRGGFTCYASGIIGFLPKRYGIHLFFNMLFILLKGKETEKRLQNVLFLTRQQDIHATSFLLRLKFFLGRFRFMFLKKKKKFALSRKNILKITHRRYTMIFISRAAIKKTTNVVLAEGVREES